jgi:hypothetical protein
MHVSQTIFRGDSQHAAGFSALAGTQPQLVLAFGAPDILRASAEALTQAFSGAHRIGCTTAGEISGDGVTDGALVVTTCRFEHTRVEQSTTELAGMADSRAAGERLGRGLPQPGLRAVIVFGQGLQINGSALLLGLAESLAPGVLVSGGLAGDGGAFVQTWVLDDLGLSSTRIACVGLYGEKLEVSGGSYGGWSPFGPARRVTRCENNVLYELDGESALAVYKRYLGEHAKGLPASGLLFPFSMLGQNHNELGLIRTILGVDEATGSLTLAGEIDPDGYLKLMHASADALVEGAAVAAQAVHTAATGDASQALALLVSCVGRKLVMGGRVDEEVEAVAEVLGQATTLAGFYAYGEMGAYGKTSQCKLHNQTMTITYLSEAA